MNYQPHLDQLKKALHAEKKEELEKYQALLSENTIAERVEQEVTLYPLEFNVASFTRHEKILLEFTAPKYLPNTFNKGSKVSCFSAKHNTEVAGRVYLTKRNVLGIELNELMLPEWINEGKIGVNAQPDLRIFEVYERFLDDAELPDRLSYFFNLSTESPNEEFYDASLNPSQNMAVKYALNNQFTIIHGAPGTGKTRTLQSLVKALVNNQKKVLFLAQANAAVDHFTREIKNAIPSLLRPGNDSRIADDNLSLTLDEKIRNHIGYKALTIMEERVKTLEKSIGTFKRNYGKEEYNERKSERKELRLLRNELHRERRKIKELTIEQADLICSTINNYLLSDSLHTIDYDYIVVDEAGQAIQPAIFPLLQPETNLVMAGDPYQLPPTIFSTEAEKLGLNVSFLEWAVSLKLENNFLNTQYRMPEDMIEFSNTFFYDGRLKSARRKVETFDEYKSVEFIDTAGSGMEETVLEGGGKLNEGEINLLKKRLEHINLSVDFAIISPYRAQIALLQEALPEYENNINTIDSFQGQEKDLIILSLVRSNSEGDVGFLKEYRRMNVALTRARKKLIVIGDSATIAHDEFYAKFLNFVEEKGSYRTVWEFDIY